MAVFYYAPKKFPHVYVQINDYSKVLLASSPTDNTCRMVSPLFADMGPDDRTMAINSETVFTELYGAQTVKRHGWLGKAIIKHLRAGGMAYVRRLTDTTAKNANASLDVTFKAALPEAAKRYLNIADGTWTDVLPAGEENTDYAVLSLTTAPSIVYGSRNHTGLKTKSDAELISVSESGQDKTVPVYVMMRTGAGNAGNKTVVQFAKIDTLSNNKDNAFQMDVLISSTQKERYRVNAVEDSRYDTIPLNIAQVLNAQSYQLNVHYTDANMTALKDNLLDALDALIVDFETAISGLTEHAGAKAAMEAQLAIVQDIRTQLDEDDIEATALVPMFAENNRFPIITSLLEDRFSYLTTVKFGGGANGEMFKGKFDWNYSIERERQTYRVYEELCKSFFEGVVEPSILDFNLVPADVIHDVGYPLAVKNTISTFTSIPKRRDIIASICPSKISSIAELKSFDEGFKLDNYMCLKVANWADFYDTDEQKTYNVPVTYLLIDTIVKFFADGWHDPILAGRVISGVVSGTVTPAVNILTDEEDKTYMVQNGWNYISSTDVGYILDGQKMASTDPYTVSILQEYHNAALIGRVMKKIVNTLNRNRHFLQRPDKIKNVMAVVNKDLEEFRNKAASIVYSAYYADQFDEAEGLLTDQIEFTLYGSNKSHKLQLDIYRYSTLGSN